MGGESSNEPAAASVSDVLREIATRDPSRHVLEAAGEVFTYGELDALSEGLAAALLDRLGPGRHHVVLLLEGTKELLVASLALVRAGLVSVPVDPTAPLPHVDRVCRDVDAVLILSDLPHADAATRPVANPLELARERPERWEDVQVGEYVSVVFTSGSTGEPKGIVISPSQRPVGAGGTDTQAYGVFQEGLRGGMLSAGSTNVAELTLQMYITLGATIVAYEVRSDGLDRFGPWLEEADIFVLHAVPTLLRHLVAALGEVRNEQLKIVYLSGEVSTWEDVAALRAHLGEDVVIVNMFGSTEVGACLCFAIDATTEIGSGPLPLGLPLAGRQVELLGEDGEPVEDGAVGEIVVTGRETALGLWGRPEETAETFAKLRSGLRRVRTGDLARCLPDGSFVFHGRRDHMVKIAGNRVELGELEAALRSLPGVAEAAARTYVDAAGELRLTASVVPSKDASLRPSVLRTELARRLPAPMLPDGIAVLDALPTLPGGKVDRLSLPVTQTLPGKPGDATSPESELEQRVLEIWSQVLGVDEIAANDDFFALGGDSLRGARVIVRLNEEFGLDLPVSTLVEAPTVRRFSDLLEAQNGGWSPLVPVRPAGDEPPLFVVHGGAGDVVFAHLLAQHLPENLPVYGLRGRAVNGSVIAETSVEELARSYLQSVRAVRPTGPYRLYGWSAGGTIAFEMARQLETEGEVVSLLALGDTPPPGHYLTAFPEEGMRGRATQRLTELRALAPAAALTHASRLAVHQTWFRLRRLGARISGRARRERELRAAREQAMAEAAAGGAAVGLDLREPFALRVYGRLVADVRAELCRRVRREPPRPPVHREQVPASRVAPVRRRRVPGDPHRRGPRRVRERARNQRDRDCPDRRDAPGDPACCGVKGDRLTSIRSRGPETATAAEHPGGHAHALVRQMPRWRLPRAAGQIATAVPVSPRSTPTPSALPSASFRTHSSRKSRSWSPTGLRAIARRRRSEQTRSTSSGSGGDPRHCSTSIPTGRRATAIPTMFPLCVRLQCAPMARMVGRPPTYSTHSALPRGAEEYARQTSSRRRLPTRNRCLSSSKTNDAALLAAVSSRPSCSPATGSLTSNHQTWTSCRSSSGAADVRACGICNRSSVLEQAPC